MSKDCAKLLAQPFHIRDVPLALVAASLLDMLSLPLACKVPVAHGLPVPEGLEDVFEISATQSCPLLWKYITNAVNPDLPAADQTSEMAWQIVWSPLFQGYPSHLSDAVASDKFRIAFRCDQTGSSSITDPLARRDVLWVVSSMPLLSAEHKSRQCLPAALNDLKNKHLGSIPALYGVLQYTLGVATAGEELQFMALPLRPGQALIKIGEPLHLGRPGHRLALLTRFTNAVRWVHTIATTGILPPVTWPIGLPQARSNPFAPDLKASLTITRRTVTKSYWAPVAARPAIKAIYKLLRTPGKVSHAIDVESVAFDRKSHPDTGAPGGFVTVVMKPVGASVLSPTDKLLESDVDFFTCALHILECVRDLHKRMFSGEGAAVHADGVLSGDRIWIRIE